MILAGKPIQPPELWDYIDWQVYKQLVEGALVTVGAVWFYLRKDHLEDHMHTDLMCIIHNIIARSCPWGTPARILAQWKHLTPLFQAVTEMEYSRVRREWPSPRPPIETARFDEQQHDRWDFINDCLAEGLEHLVARIYGCDVSTLRLVPCA
jgi:hypothetical protein